jgi:hypothetical protein
MKNLAYLLCAVLLFSSCDNNEEFKKNGVLTQATILEKLEKRKSKHTKQTVFRVNFFTQPDKENPKPAPEKKEKKNVDDIINNLGNPDAGKLGNYTSAELIVNNAEFEKYKVGDKVEIYYLKDTPSKARLKEYVDK